MKKVLVAFGLITIIVCGGFAMQKWNKTEADFKTAKFNEDVDNLFYALQKYKEQVGSYPIGSNAEVVRALMGNNPKNLMILVGRKKDLDSKGQIVDPWGTPLRIYFSGEGVLIRSAGPNKRFDDSTVPNPDDYYRSN